MRFLPDTQGRRGKYLVLQHRENSAKDGDETDVDCGGRTTIKFSISRRRVVFDYVFLYLNIYLFPAHANS